jgi:hypothetical protein
MFNGPFQNFEKGGLEPRIIIVTKHVLVKLRSASNEEENWVCTNRIIVTRAVIEPCKARHNVLCSSYVASSDKAQELPL